MHDAQDQQQQDMQRTQQQGLGYREEVPFLAWRLSWGLILEARPYPETRRVSLAALIQYEIRQEEQGMYNGEAAHKVLNDDAGLQAHMAKVESIVVLESTSP